MSALKANEEAWTLPGWQSRVSAENLGQSDKARSAFSNDPSGTCWSGTGGDGGARSSMKLRGDL